MTLSNNDAKIVHLEKESELRFTVCEPGDKITIQLVTGYAEIFGSELMINSDYVFSYFSSAAIFTWQGCTLKIGKEGSKYSKYQIKASTHIPKMKDLHEHLEELRTNAEKNNTNFPITLVVGPTDVGKSTLCRFLLNYAAKHGRKPIFIDLDVGQSSLSLTGTFGVLPVQEPSDVNGRFNERALSVYYFGYKSPGHNMMLYKLLVEKIGRTLENRLNRKHRIRTSGVLIDTCGWVDGGGYTLITEIIKMLNVNMILVLSEYSLYSKLKRDVPRSQVLYVDRFRNVVTRNRAVRIDNRNTSVYEYFYGPLRQLQPFTIKVNFNNLQIFKANYSKESYNVETSNVTSVSIEPSILYQVLGLSYAEHIENIPVTSVYGFICIVELDMDSEILTVLSPHPGPLPTNYLLMGDITLPSEEMIS